MNIVFLSKNQAQEMFKEPDEYAVRLPLSNLSMICPENPTLEAYQEIFLNSFEDFSDGEKKRLLSYARTLPFEITIKLIKTNGSHSLDITQTRKDAIIATHGKMSFPTFVHEIYHIISRYNPELTNELSKMFGFKKLDKEVKIDHEAFLLNPDALFNDFSINVYNLKTKQNIEVTPFVGLGLQTFLKIKDKDEYLHSSETNYKDLIFNTDYITHPEEICAEYFALLYAGHCIFPNNENLVKLFEFKELITKKLKQYKILL